MKKLLLLLVGWILLTSIFAQNQQGIIYTNGDWINCSVIEGDYLWVGTYNGLVKINRQTGETVFYDHSNSLLPLGSVTSIAIDSQGAKWIGLRKDQNDTVGYFNLLRFDNTTWSIYEITIPDPYSGCFVGCITIDSNDVKWIGTNNGLVRFDGVNWTVFDTFSSGYRFGWISSISIDSQGILWIAAEGLIRFDGVNFTVYNSYNDGASFFSASCVAIDSQNVKWISTERDGILCFDGENWEIVDATNSGLIFGPLNNISIDSQNVKWFGTGGSGIIRYDGETWTSYTTDNSGLPCNYVYSITIDPQGAKWIGTVDRLVKFDDNIWTMYNTSNSGLPSNSIKFIYIDSQDNKWIGNDIDYLTLFQGEAWTVYDLNDFIPGLPCIALTCITIDSQGVKWIGTTSGLLRFDGETWIYYNTTNSGLPSNYITSITVDSQGEVWLSTLYDTSIVRFDGETWSVYNCPYAAWSGDIVRCITIDSQNVKWIGTDDEGLFRFDGETWRNYSLPVHGSVACISVDSQDVKWIGTSWGLVRFENENFTLYSVLNSGLPERHVNCLSIDSQGVIWIGTYSGLTRFDGETWLTFNTSNSILSDYGCGSISIDSQDNKWIASWGLTELFWDAISNQDQNQFPPTFLNLKNYPNPFNPSTTISFDLPKDSEVELSIYNIKGQKVATLLNENKLKGNHSVVWNGKDANNKSVSSGIYFSKLQTGNKTLTRKMILLK